MQETNSCTPYVRIEVMATRKFEEEKTINYLQMSSAPWTRTRPAEGRDEGRILEMAHGEGWDVLTQPMLKDFLGHGVVSVTTDADDHILSRLP